MKPILFSIITLAALFSVFNLKSKTSSNSPIKVGSKIFTEGYILGEIIAQKLESKNFKVERALGLGATGVTEEAIKTGAIDVIADYAGSLSYAHLDGKNYPLDVLKNKLAEKGYTLSPSLGFNNTYTLAVRTAWAKENNIRTFSDLKKIKILKAAFTPEFTSRAENWPSLKKFYGFNNFSIFEMDHQLAYQALSSGKADVVEAYSTDAKLAEFKLITLNDDQKFFPDYSAVIVAKTSWVDSHAQAWSVLLELSSLINEQKMIELNSYADVDKKVLLK